MAKALADPSTPQNVMKYPSSLWTAALMAAMISISAQAQDSFSWQTPNARVVPTGDLEWTPQPFVFQAGASRRYIDFENGNDANDGTTPATAFKRHPWDSAATGQAKATTGIHTYIFKRGVVYRGFLVAKESGQDGDPIRLTSDPDWGVGEACLYGSERLTTGWQRCTPADAQKINDLTNVWYIDLPFNIEGANYGGATPAPISQMVCELVDGELQRINLARAPNWAVTNPDYPQKNWWSVPSNGQHTLPETFPQTNAADWIGGSVWSNWGTGSGGDANMASFEQGRITGYTNGVITIDIRSEAGCKYFIENLPQLLDEPNEYFYFPGSPFPKRFYVWLSGNRDPNTAVIEVAARNSIIRIVDRHDIVISGLTIALNNQPRPGIVPEPPHWNCGDGNNQAVEISGTCARLTVANCKFRHVVMAIAQRRAGSVASSAFDRINILDNDIAYVEDQGVTLSSDGSPGYVRHCSILRNKVSYTGHRQTCRGYSSLPAMFFSAVTSMEIAGNFVESSWGQGINVSTSVGNAAQPGSQVLMLVHHNKVTRSLLGSNDWGGIEGWGQGPSYFFNNISGNARGYRSFSGDFNEWNPWGHAIYFDHAHHHRAFNNIVYGVHNSANNAQNRNGSGFMQAAGDHHLNANNTIYKLYRGYCSSSEGCVYVGNLAQDITFQFHHEGSPLPWTAYAKNVYFGNPQRFNPGNSTFDSFRQTLQAGAALSSQLGLMSGAALLLDPDNGDYRPQGDALGNGARVFIPWTLAQVRGEWHFFAHPADYRVISSDNDPSGGTGTTLSCPNAKAADFIKGNLEDWTDGALRFDGASLSCTPAASTTFDFSTNSFLIEAYFRTTSSGTIVSKADTIGYWLEITAEGLARLVLAGTAQTSRVSAAAVNDGQWHHLVAEVDRAAGAINLFLDGQTSNGPLTGAMPASGESLSNGANFYVGRDNGGALWTGDLDFLRVAAASFAQGETSYDELYAWQFDGPATRDFSGRKVTGVRNAGAIHFVDPESIVLDNFSVSQSGSILSWTGLPGWSYTVWRSADLVTWTEVETKPGVDGAMTCADATPPPVFYVIKAVTP